MTDPTTPTPDEIARWAALADGATPGPWHQATPTSAYLMCPGCEHGNYVAQAMDNGHYEHRHERSADAEFIAAAREAVPRLLALVAAQAEQIAEWEGGVAVTRSRLLAAELDAGLVIEASRTRADKAEAELADLHATDDYQRWAQVVAERDAAREAVGRVRALCNEAEAGEGIVITPGFTTYYAVDTGLLRDALAGEPTAIPATLPMVPLTEDENRRILDAAYFTGEATTLDPEPPR